MHKMTCPNCKERLPVGAAFCPMCFRKLIAEENYASITITPNTRRIQLFAIKVFISISIIMALWPSPIDTPVKVVLSATKIPKKTPENVPTAEITDFKTEPISTPQGEDLPKIPDILPIGEISPQSSALSTLNPATTGSLAPPVPGKIPDTMTPHITPSGISISSSPTSSATVTPKPNAPTSIPTPMFTPKNTEKPAPTPASEALFTVFDCGDSVSIVKYFGGEVNLVIPDYIKGKKVFRIDSQAFINHRELEYVKLPSYCTEIDYNAFGNCASLRKVILPDGLKIIRAEAFSGCTSLEELKLPEGLKDIGNNMIEDTAISHIAIPTSVEYTGSAFNKCNTLSYIDVAPDNENYCSIDGVLFKTTGNSGKYTLIRYPAAKRDFTEYTVPVNVCSIDDFAFAQNTTLQKIILSNITSSIFAYAFKETSNLERIVTTRALEYIKKGAFEDCNPKLRLTVYEGSYAQNYAAEHNIAYDLYQ